MGNSEILFPLERRGFQYLISVPYAVLRMLNSSVMLSICVMQFYDLTACIAYMSSLMITSHFVVYRPMM